VSEQLAKPPRRLPLSLAPTSSTPIVLGIAGCATGFVLIAYCWSQVALRMHVADQMAYVVSSGFTGIGLICVGAVLVSIQVRRRDAEQQFRRLEQIVFRARGKHAPTERERPTRERERAGVVAKVKALREPVRAALATSVLAVVAGFALIAFAWYRVSDEMDVAVQAPYVVSGGMAGLALIAAGCLFAHVLISRGLEQQRGDAIADIVGAVTSAGTRAKR
jgi:TRAP-type C4-dicarboxylate transport system permease small subunit